MVEGLAFWIHVTPRAQREAVGGRRGDALRVCVQAPPVAGRANAACVEALAQAFGIKRRDVELDPNARGRRKRVRLIGDVQALEERLRELAGSGRLG